MGREKKRVYRLVKGAEWNVALARYLENYAWLGPARVDRRKRACAIVVVGADPGRPLSPHADGAKVKISAKNMENWTDPIDP